jgi:hypothetical protein
MGTAASVSHIYQTGFDWFKQVNTFQLSADSCRDVLVFVCLFVVPVQYFDENLYIDDFHSMDLDNNGGTYEWLCDINMYLFVLIEFLCFCLSLIW